jgi:hypothetical protein
MATKRVKATASVGFNPLAELEVVNFTVATRLLPRRSIREEELNVLTEERDSFRRAAEALLEERKKWQDQSFRAIEQVRGTQAKLNELKCANALLRRAVEETNNPELRLNAILASPAFDAIFEQLETTGKCVLTPNSTAEERELLVALVQLGKLDFDGAAVLTDAGRELLRDWA